MILPKERDPRFITIRRGGTLTDANHRLLAEWAALCAEHVLPHFEALCPDDPRPREAIEQARAWAAGEIAMSQSRTSAGKANAAARDLSGAPRFAAYAAAQAAAVAHVAAHELGAAAYAIKAAVAAAAARGEDPEVARAQEAAWQRERLAPEIRALVLDDQQRRDGICWHVFGDPAPDSDHDDTADFASIRPPLDSLISKSAKAQSKLAPGTWQHTMLDHNLKALRLSTALMDGDTSALEVLTDRDLEEIHSAFDSMISRTERSSGRFAPGTSHHTLQDNRLRALRGAQALVPGHTAATKDRPVSGLENHEVR